MERKLASIQQILSLEPIPDANQIELAKVLGWQIVVKKGDFAPGGLCCYCEIDAILPEKPEFEFLRNRNFRIKTVKLRKTLSQGICFPISILPPREKPYEIGEDVTELLNIRKYEPQIPECLRGNIEGQFPSHLLPKTDEIRIQSCPNVIQEILGIECYVSTKIDGTSSTFLWAPGKTGEPAFRVCSRNLMMSENGDKEVIYWRVAKELNLSEKIQQEVAIQGEIAGPGIQKNPLGLSKAQLFVFNVYDLELKRWFNYKDFVNFCKERDLQTVPIERTITFDETNSSLDQLLLMAEGYYPSGKRKEGIVIRPVVEKYSQVLRGRLSFKVINNQFLLKDEE